MQEELEAAKQVVVRAGAILLEHYSRRSVRWKGRGNRLADADYSASTFLVSELTRFFPGDGILCKGQPDGSARLSKPRVWIIDPLGGASEFIDHRPEFAVMIGMAVEMMPSVGVVYQPAAERLYYAIAGSGAFVIEDRKTRLLRVSSETDPAKMCIALSRSHPSAEVEVIQRQLGIKDSIRLESRGLKIGLICEGRAHLYLHMDRHTHEWDTCAPQVILHEAGGRMTDTMNTILHFNTAETRNLHGLIASNGTIHGRVVDAAKCVLAKTV